MSLIIRSSSIHAAGCYTTAPIASRTLVVEYTGPRISKAEADERYEDMALTYLFGVGDGARVIDGHGTAMFINHSCDPNCEADERRGKVWIIALRDIQPGEELTYDYNLYDGDDDDARCNCGTKKCRKTMFSPDEVRRLKRAAARKAKSVKAPAKKRGKRLNRPPAKTRSTGR